MTNLTKHQTNSPAILGGWESLEQFRAQLNAPPKADEVLTNKMANNALYIPIGAIEAKLDTVFQGLWKTHSYTQSVIGNEVTGSIILEVYHPAGQWISRVGTASVMIQMHKGSDVADGLSAKIKNTLVKDIPHLKAECFKNAAKSLGDFFGRSLNRGMEFDLSNATSYDQVIEQLLDIHTEEEARLYYQALPRTLKGDKRVTQAFMNRIAGIKQEGGRDAV
jgi:hypothetical protein